MALTARRQHTVRAVMCSFMILLLAVCVSGLERNTSTWHHTKLLPANVTRGGVQHGDTSVLTRVVGGKVATAHAFPYQVALLISNTDGTFLCGGSLIQDEWVLTAAHCVESFTGTVDVILGAQNIRLVEAAQLLLTSTEVHVHPKWDKLALKNDIALIRLSSKVQLGGPNISTVNLPSKTQQSSTFASQTGILTGWGKTSDVSDVSPELRYVKGKILSNWECEQIFGQVHDSNICLSGYGIIGGCNGDSGGPLVVEDGSGVRTQVGIVSFGYGTCSAGYPTAFTRVTSYSDWILSVTSAALTLRPCFLLPSLLTLLLLLRP